MVAQRELTPPGTRSHAVLLRPQWGQGSWRVEAEGVSGGLSGCLEKPQGDFRNSKQKAPRVSGLFLREPSLVGSARTPLRKVDHITWGP